jgi:hypothetical protein
MTVHSEATDVQGASRPGKVPPGKPPSPPPPRRFAVIYRRICMPRHAIRWKTCDTPPNEDFWVGRVCSQVPKFPSANPHFQKQPAGQKHGESASESIIWRVVVRRVAYVRFGNTEVTPCQRNYNLLCFTESSLLSALTIMLAVRGHRSQVRYNIIIILYTVLLPISL